MRFLFLLVLLAGAALGIAYPWAASNVAGYEIGTWRIYDREEGFTPAEATLAAPEAPVAIAVDIRTDGALTRAEGRPLLTLEISGDGEPVQSLTLDFADAEARTINPQSGETGYRIVADRLAIIDHNRYRFEFEPGEAMTDRLISADLTLNAGAFDLDPRAIPAGFILMAVGLIGFVASFFRRRRSNPNSQHPPPRWGRGGKS
ncbi:MAG: hypothetical protein JJ913_15300 [Rhizobiaceae bacterium]|nr:hypothetical protein [Rhizobiaceae bacterium]